MIFLYWSGLTNKFKYTEVDKIDLDFSLYMIVYLTTRTMSTLHEQLTLAIKNTSLNIAPNTDWTVEEYHEFMAYVHAGWLWQDCGKWFEIHPDWDKPPMWCPDDDEEEDVFIKRGSKDILGFFKRKEDLCCSETGEIDEETGFKVMDCDLCGQGLIEE